MEILNYEDAAKVLGVGKQWLQRNCRKEGIPHKKIGRRVRFSRSMLEQWVAQQDHKTVELTDENIE